MKLKTRSLRTNLLIYFLIFSTIILLFLYFFQILFLNTYYQINQSGNLESVITSIEKNYKNKNYEEIFNELTSNNEVCIQIMNSNKMLYYSDYYKHCASKDDETLKKIQADFINTDEKNIKVKFINNAYNNKTLMHGKKIDDTIYVFANATLEPIDKSISLLRGQFIYVALTVLILSFIISYYFSKRLSDPIVKMSKFAKKIGKKDYNINISINTEIHELNELAETLNKTVKELEKAEKLEHEFLANVGHDLKTPLTMIEAYAASARDLNYNKKAKRERDLNIIIDEAERLNMLVNDILLLSRMKSKTVKLNKEVINITELIKTILKRFVIYENEGYEFIFTEKRAYYIEADKKDIERVIYNLIINAINYTGEDKKVTIKLENDHNMLTVKIIDTGVGISEEDKILVWNKYYRTNKRHRRTTVGTGLGLSIVKEILTNHKFTFGIESKNNKGSTFYFSCKIKEK